MVAASERGQGASLNVEKKKAFNRLSRHPVSNKKEAKLLVRGVPRTSGERNGLGVRLYFVGVGGVTSVSSTSWRSERVRGFCNIAVAPQWMTDNSPGQSAPETRMIRALGFFAKMLRHAVTPLSPFIR